MLFVGPRLAHGEGTRSDRSAIEGLNRCPGAFGRHHRDEPKPARPTAGVIGGDIHLRDIAVRGEQIPQIAFGGRNRQIVHIESRIHSLRLVKRALAPFPCGACLRLPQVLGRVAYTVEPFRFDRAQGPLSRPAFHRNGCGLGERRCLFEETNRELAEESRGRHRRMRHVTLDGVRTMPTSRPAGIRAS